LKQFGVEIVKMAPLEQMAVKRKARALFDARKVNLKLGENVAKLEMAVSGQPGLPPHVPLLLKLFDDGSNQTKILKVTSSHRAEDLAALVSNALGRDLLLQLHTSPTAIGDLNPETLLEAHSSICRGEQKCLILLAM
jgi:hypothetical protein